MAVIIFDNLIVIVSWKLKNQGRMYSLLMYYSYEPAGDMTDFSSFSAFLLSSPQFHERTGLSDCLTLGIFQPLQKIK